MKRITLSAIISDFTKNTAFLAVILFLAFASFSAQAQVNYTQGWEDEDAELAGWTTQGMGDPFMWDNYLPCAGDASAVANAYAGEVSRLRSPNLGPSLGGLINLQFSYKALQWWDDTSALPSEMSILVHRATAQGGPWTLVHTINSGNYIPSESCATASVNFVAPAGNFFLRFTVEALADGDLYYYIDNVNVTETPLVAPVITSFTPDSYCAASGVVTITGTGFTGAALTIGGTPVTMTTNTATQIVATVPAGVSGTISITTPGGTVASATPFAVTAPPALTLSSASVSICEGSPSDPLTITAGASDYDSFVWSPSAGVTGTGNSGFVFDVEESTAYTLTASNTTSGCVIVIPVAVNVNMLPDAITIAPATPSVCANAITELTVTGASASGSAVMGTGTTAPGQNTFPNPFSAYYGGLKTQMLYRADELAAQGLVAGMPISSISFDFFASAAFTNNQLKIRIGTTANNNLTGGFVPLGSLTTVYDATYTPTAGTIGLVEFDFLTDYIWDGNNIVVEVVHNQGNNGNGAGTRNRTTNTSYDSVIFGAIDGLTPAGTASIDALTEDDFEFDGYIDVSNLRPNAVFNYSFENPVTWTPAEGLYTDAEATMPYTGEEAEVVYAMVGTTTMYTATATNDSGCTISEEVTVTVISPILDPVEDVTACNSYTLPELAVGNYYTGPGGTGNMLLAGEIITITMDVYVWEESGTVPNCTAEDSFTVTIIPAPEADDPADVTVCDFYALPALMVGNYYTGDSGSGTMLVAGDLITETTTIRVYAVNGDCSDENSFVVTVINTGTVTAPVDVAVCGSYTLPVLTTGDYYTQTGGLGQMLEAGDVITESATIYVYIESGTTPNCTDEDSFQVNINSVDRPEGEEMQNINVISGDEATIEDIVVIGEGIIWYASEEDAIGGTGALAAGTLLESGATYYATQTIGDCTSIEVLAVTVNIVLGTDGFNIRSFSYHPNPVKDILNLSYSSDITSVAVFNLLGQQVAAQKINSTEGTIDMSNLADGAYIVNITAGNHVKTIKVIKQQ